jgi:hypothetical protein
MSETRFQKLNRKLIIKKLDQVMANFPPNKATGPDSIPYALWASIMDELPKKMRIWAGRLGPILNQIVRGHQLGFIPGRDGRDSTSKSL